VELCLRMMPPRLSRGHRLLPHERPLDSKQAGRLMGRTHRSQGPGFLLLVYTAIPFVQRSPFSSALALCPMTLKDALRELVQAAVRFEFKAARHARIDPERAALREAITRAQLLLSVEDRGRSRQAEDNERPADSSLRPRALKAITGGKAKGATRRGTAKRKE
jgi:hypothetical protein